MLWADLRNIYVWTLIFVSLSLSGLGLIDDVLKIKYKKFYDKRGFFYEIYKSDMDSILMILFIMKLVFYISKSNHWGLNY